MSDLKYAVRQLLRRPAFATLAVGTIALAVGAATAIFSVVDAVLFRPLPYPESSRMVTIWNTYPHWREREILSRFWDSIQLSYPEYETLRAEATVYDAVAVHRTDDGTYFGAERPEVIGVGLASHTLPAVLRISPVIGRWFDASEDRPDGAPVAVVRYEFWRTRLGGDTAAVGAPIRLDGGMHTLIGVLPPEFAFTRPDDPVVPDVWLPVGHAADQHDEGNHSFDGVARLADGVTLAQAQLETEDILRGESSPDVRGARIVERKEQEVARARPVLLMVFGAVGVILLLACANVANLMLGRAAERNHEIAVRRALGATRPRIGRQVLMESLVVAVLGGSVGSVLAWWGTGGLVNLIPAGVPRLTEVTVDLRVLGFAFLVSLVAGLLFALVPVHSASRREVYGSLKEGGRISAGHGPSESGLVVAQISLTVVLLVGALLLVRSLLALGDVDPGFRHERLLTFRVELPDDRYRDALAVTAFFDRLDARLQAIPGVQNLAATSVLPLSGESASNSVWLASYGPEDPERRKPEVQRRIVQRGYLEALGVERIAGRLFDETDRADAAPVMIVSRLAIEELWEGNDALGDRVEMNNRWWTVVGIVGDVRDQRLEAEPQRTVYVPFAQWPTAVRTIALRTSVPPLSLADDVQGAVRSLDPLLPITELRSMDQVRKTATEEHRFRALLVSMFGVLAATLAAVGIFGVTARAVARRTREVGVRTALGATRWDVLRLILGRVGSLALLGFVLGLLGSFAVGRLLRGFLFGVTATDPVTYMVTGVAVLVLALVAGLVPATRAALNPPMEALRYE